MSTDEIRTATLECRVQTDRFGPARLRACELPRLKGTRRGSGPPQFADRGVDLLPQIVPGDVALVAQFRCTLQARQPAPAARAA